MTDMQRNRRYCAACGQKGHHTTLDHKICPKKREILRERARIEREKRLANKNASSRDIELIRKTIDITNKEDFPTLKNQTTQHLKMAAIVTLALIDEANNPGIF